MSFIAEVAFVEVFVEGRGVLLFAFLTSEAAVFFVVAVVFCTLPIAFLTLERLLDTSLCLKSLRTIINSFACPDGSP